MMVNISHIDEHSFVNLMPIPPVHSESATKIRELKNFVIYCFV